MEFAASYTYFNPLLQDYDIESDDAYDYIEVGNDYTFTFEAHTGYHTVSLQNDKTNVTSILDTKQFKIDSDEITIDIVIEDGEIFIKNNNIEIIE